MYLSRSVSSSLGHAAAECEDPAVKNEQMPVLVGVVSGAIGAALVARPQLATGPLGLSGEDAAMRFIGATDLILVPGLLRGEPRWPWMLTRAALNLGVAAYLARAASQASSPAPAQAAAAAMVALTVADGATGLSLRRGGV